MSDLKIAVVNDDTVFLELMQELLSEEGYEVFIWKEGSSAYQKIKSAQPHLVVLDIRMEQPEGSLSILELLKLDPETSKIPIIVCSADLHALKTNEENYRKHGIRSLPKPFDVDDLVLLVAEVLRQSREG